MFAIAEIVRLLLDRIESLEQKVQELQQDIKEYKSRDWDLVTTSVASSSSVSSHGFDFSDKEIEDLLNDVG